MSMHAFTRVMGKKYLQQKLPHRIEATTQMALMAKMHHRNLFVQCALIMTYIMQQNDLV